MTSRRGERENRGRVCVGLDDDLHEKRSPFIINVDDLVTVAYVSGWNMFNG